MAEARLKRATGVGWQTFEGVAVLLNPGRDLVHECNRVGTWIWEQLDGKKSHDELLQGLTLQFDVDETTAEADLSLFAKQLTELGLVVAD